MRKTLDDLHIIIKLILVIFLGGLYGGIYRILGGTVKDIIIGLIWIFTGGIFGIGWIIDVITVVLKGKPTLLA